MPTVRRAPYPGAGNGWNNQPYRNGNNQWHGGDHDGHDHYRRPYYGGVTIYSPVYGWPYYGGLPTGRGLTSATGIPATTISRIRPQPRRKSRNSIRSSIQISILLLNQRRRT